MLEMKTLVDEHPEVKVYIVGGYVRDRLLGRDGKDHDFVVVKATPQMMLNAGFKQVGADFPVYLNSIGDEYALARTERKTGGGYHGFETDFSTDVTLEDDLKRRDLTINSMAREVIGWNELGHAKLSDDIIDPFNGQKHLRKGIIKHTSKAFKEDPVRILRAARFRARYSFDVAKSTKNLMTKMVDAGEVDHLTPERVWSEFEKAMGEPEPILFFWTLMECGAYYSLFPELGKSLISSGWPLSTAVLHNLSTLERLAIVFSGIPREDAVTLLDRLKAPSDVKRLSLKMRVVLEAVEKVQHRMGASSVWDMDNKGMLELLNTLDVYRRPDDLYALATISSMYASKTRHRLDHILQAFQQTKGVNFATLDKKAQDTLTGKEIGAAIEKERLKRIDVDWS